MSRTTVSIKWTDKGKKLKQQLKELESLEVAIGFQAGKAAEKDGTDICEIAAYNEFGTSRIPSRPFMRQTIDHYQSAIGGFVQRLGGPFMEGTIVARDVFQRCGVYIKGRVQAEIKGGNFVPNSPYTIAKKGSSRPLIDTGRMRQSVDFMIRRKGSGMP